MSQQQEVDSTPVFSSRYTHIHNLLLLFDLDATKAAHATTLDGHVSTLDGHGQL